MRTSGFWLCGSAIHERHYINTIDFYCLIKFIYLIGSEPTQGCASR